MSYDLVAEANYHIAINFGSVTMGKILAVLRANGALDETTPKPAEPSTWTPEHEGEWKAILAQRSPHPLQIPVWKFRDNHGWIVHPDECYHLYHLLRAVPDPMVQRVARFCRRCVTNGGFAVL